MNRSVLLGLFVTASMMASTSFAASKPDTLCDTNIQTITNAKAQLASSPELTQRAEASLSKAQALKAKGQIEECIAETNQTITELQKNSSSNN